MIDSHDEEPSEVFLLIDMAVGRISQNVLVSTKRKAYRLGPPEGVGNMSLTKQRLPEKAAKRRMTQTNDGTRVCLMSADQFFDVKSERINARDMIITPSSAGGRRTNRAAATRA